ncbi:MAG: protein translocase subunit SecF [Gammaproteobacteria bacterium]|nr:protein translocase subunit SecF [Gammaproteobacteria bacterium]
MRRFTGLEFFHKKTTVNFLGPRKILAIISVVLMVGSLLLVLPAVRGLNFGIDFTGGVLLEVGYPGPANLADVRSRLAKGGFGDAQVQNFGTARDVMIRVLPREGQNNQQEADKILAVLKAGDPAVELRRTEFVGPQVGDELSEQGALAGLFAFILIGIYVALRFQWKFAIGALIATLHDPIITLGIFALFQIPFDLSALAAILAIVGYSVNDTVVVFDRIRENFRKIRRGTPEEIMNQSVNETLSRTIMTSVVTLLVVVAMLLVGGETLRGFSIALCIGIFVGTYSSIYIASAAALMLNAGPADMVTTKKDKDAVDALP